MVNKLIVGLSGTFAGGKGTLGRFLAEEFGLLNVSTSDMLNEETMRRFGDIDRPHKVEVARELRHAHGGGVLALKALEKFDKDVSHDGVLVNDMRSIGEMNAVKAAGGLIIFVDAPVELRYKRMAERARDAEAKISLDEFKQREAVEWGPGATDADFDLGGIKQCADIILVNDSTTDELRKQAIEQIESHIY